MNGEEIGDGFKKRKPLSFVKHGRNVLSVARNGAPRALLKIGCARKSTGLPVSRLPG